MSAADRVLAKHPHARKRVLREIGDERLRQIAKWGEQSHPDGTSPGAAPFRHTDVNLDLRTGVEVANILRRRCDKRFRDGIGTWLDILLEEVGEALAEDEPEKLREELLQVAAVAVAWVEAIDRRAPIEVWQV